MRFQLNVLLKCIVYKKIIFESRIIVFKIKQHGFNAFLWEHTMCGGTYSLISIIEKVFMSILFAHKIFGRIILKIIHRNKRIFFNIFLLIKSNRGYKLSYFLIYANTLTARLQLHLC